MPGPEGVTLTTQNIRPFLESIGLLPAAKQVTMMVFSGQSNVLSAGYINQFQGTGNALDVLQPSVLRQFSRVFIWNPSLKVFQLMQAGVNNLDYNGSIGPEIGFAQRWEELNPTGLLYIVKQSIPGVPISTWDVGQQGWTELSTWVRDAKAALAAAGLAVKVVGFWWNQGESNGGDGAYFPKLQNLTDRLYGGNLLTVDTLTVLGMMRFDQVMRAQQNLYLAKNAAYATSVETNAYNMNSDNLHFKATTQFLSGHTDIYNKVFKLTSAYPFPMSTV